MVWWTADLYCSHLSFLESWGKMQGENYTRDTGSSALFQEFGSAAARAYSRPYLVSNPTLSKINQHSLFFEYSQGKSAQVPSYLAVARNIFLSYVKSGIEMLLLAGAVCLQKVSGHQKFLKGKQELFVDAYVVVGSNTNSGLENYLPLLQPVACKHNWKLTVMPRYYGSRNLFLRQKQIAGLRTAGFDVLTEPDLLFLSDYFYLCVHIVAYPWLVLALASGLPRTREGNFVRFALLSEIGQSSLSGAIRYRQGRRLARLVSSGDRLVQWHENQPYDKNLNRGLRSAGARIPIYGAQLLAAAEALDASGGVDDALLARVVRVAIGADVEVDLQLGGLRRPLVAAGTLHLGVFVRGVDASLHAWLPSMFVSVSSIISRRDHASGVTPG